MPGKVLHIGKKPLTFSDLQDFVTESPQVFISSDAHDAIVKCRNYLDKKLQVSDELFYGINTGFGFLQNVKVDKARLGQLQNNLIKSHACGIGEDVPQEIVKLMMMLKIKSLSFGNSGISIEVVQRLADMYNKNILPVIYTQGSLGASGDLAPLSHLSLPLIGLGEVNFEGKKYNAQEVLDKNGWEAVKLQSKEGLALINGTQFMSAYGAYILVHAGRLLQWADLISAISFEAFDCVPDCFNEKLHSIRPHKGQVYTATSLRKILEGSEISSQKKSQVQDPYSFRCIPQVHGATRDVYDNVSEVFLKETNSVTDNPNIFPDEDLILSGGNFHGQPLALSLDFLSIAMAEIASISERRTFQLLSGQRELPLFLIKDPGLHSGLMMPQYTAASIVSENKQLCTPSSVDTISSSNNQEDHVSMGANAATKCLRIVQNVEKVLAIELLTAAQALQYRKPLRSSPIIEKVITEFRKKVAFNESDRVLHDDIQASISFMKKIIFSLFLFLFAGSAFSQSAEISKMEWLVGSWKGLYNDKPFFEAWRKVNDSTLVNFSIVVTNDDIKVKEESTIGLHDQAIMLGKQWTLKRLTPNEIVFENDTLKFSNRIIWLHTSNDHWFTILENPTSTAYYDMTKIPELEKYVDRYIVNSKLKMKNEK